MAIDRRTAKAKEAQAAALAVVQHWPDAWQLRLDIYADAYHSALDRYTRRALKWKIDQEMRSPSPHELASVGNPTALEFLERLKFCQESEKRSEEFNRKRHCADAIRDAEWAAIHHDCPSWGRLKSAIYERDGGICWICGQPVEWKYYELGHLRDRVCGGSDTPDNLVVMCIYCNRIEKGLHERIGDAERCYGRKARPTFLDGIGKVS